MIDVRAQFPLEPGWPRWAMDWDRVDAIVIHHTAVDPRSPEDVALLLPAAEMSPGDELAHIAVIHLYHKSIGYGGFGYHLIVFPSGRVYYVTSLYVWGAHIGGMNDTKFGVVAAGDFRSISPGTAQFQGLWEAINFIREILTFALCVGPHSRWTNTSCPGMVWPLPKEDDMNEQERAEFDELKGQVADMQVIVDRIRGPVPDVTPEMGIWDHIKALRLGQGGSSYTDEKAVAAVKAKL